MLTKSEKELQHAIQFAKKNGFKTAERENVKEWRFFNDLPVFTPVFDSDDIVYVGQPQFIVVNNSVPRFLTDNERDIVMGFSNNITIENALLTAEQFD